MNNAFHVRFNQHTLVASSIRNLNINNQQVCSINEVITIVSNFGHYFLSHTYAYLCEIISNK